MKTLLAAGDAWGIFTIFATIAICWVMRDWLMSDTLTGVRRRNRWK